MQTPLSSAMRIARSSLSTVLITGPTGAGKSRLARELHDGGPLGGKPFVCVNLASVHEGTLESELFGHEKGAFTGAEQRRVGRIEQAQGGTLFLDEVGELPPRLQARLLEFIQTRTVTPVGANRAVALRIRVIAATHRDLARAVREGAFRADLYHRLRVIELRLGGLRERTDEFDGVLHSCLNEVCAQLGRRVLRVSEAAALRLEAYGWPGNYRELRNVLEYAVLSSQGGEIREEDLPSWFGTGFGGTPEAPARALAPHTMGVAEVELTYDFGETLARFEREYLRQALRRHRGRINRTALKIGMNKTTLLRRIRTHGLKSDVLHDLENEPFSAEKTFIPAK